MLPLFAGLLKSRVGACVSTVNVKSMVPVAFPAESVAVKWTTCKPIYEQHVKETPYTVYHNKVETYHVPVKYCTYRPVHTKHEVDVPVVTCKTIMEPCEKIVKTCVKDKVWYECPVTVKTGDWIVAELRARADPLHAPQV